MLKNKFKKGYTPWNKGKKVVFSEEHKTNISKAKTGGTRPPSSEETKKRQSIAMQGFRHTKETIEKIRNSKKGKPHFNQRGEKAGNWKGGVTPINQAIRTSLEYKLWRTAVFERDNYTCIWGGKEHGSKLNADHIKAFSQYPELRFAIDNGRTLCHDCHKTTDNYGYKACKK